MDMLRRMMVHARGAIKGQIDQAEHVEGGQERTERSQPVEQIVVMREGMGENFVFAPEACQWRNARNSNRADQKQPVGPGDLRAEAAHLSNVLFTRERMDDRPGREEQESLEEGMGHQVEE